MDWLQQEIRDFLAERGWRREFSSSTVQRWGYRPETVTIEFYSVFDSFSVMAKAGREHDDVGFPLDKLDCVLDRLESGEYNQIIQEKMQMSYAKKKKYLQRAG